MMPLEKFPIDEAFKYGTQIIKPLLEAAAPAINSRLSAMPETASERGTRRDMLDELYDKLDAIDDYSNNKKTLKQLMRKLSNDRVKIALFDKKHSLDLNKIKRGKITKKTLKGLPWFFEKYYYKNTTEYALLQYNRSIKRLKEIYAENGVDKDDLDTKIENIGYRAIVIL